MAIIIISDEQISENNESTYYFTSELFNLEEGIFFIGTNYGCNIIPADYAPEDYFENIAADFEFTGATGTLVLK